MRDLHVANTWIIRAALAAVAGLAIVAIVGCGSSSPTPAEQRLIDQADAICADSQRAMQDTARSYSPEVLAKLRHPDYAQSERQVGYATALAEISTSKVERLAALKPPASMRRAFERYVEGERQVYYDDLAASGAAHAVHVGEYIAALARHHRHEQKALELAGDAGLGKCERSE